MPEDMLTSKAAAKLCGVTEETMRRWAEKQQIRHIRLPSGHLRFRRIDLIDALTPIEPHDGEPVERPA